MKLKLLVIERSHDQLQLADLDAFPSGIAEPDLIRYFTLSGVDLELVRQQRGGRFRCRGCNGALTE